MIEARKFIAVDGLQTAYYGAGSGPTVVLLHSGEFGGCAELTWEFNFHALAAEFHVVAPDWLGCGGSEKVHDFVLGYRRKLLHMRRFLEVMGIGAADFIGSSMGGALAVRALAAEPDFFAARSLTLIGAGGFAPDNEHRRALLEYDCSIEAMRRIVVALFHGSAWADDEAYVRRRHTASIEPGVWECAAAARFKNPLFPPRPDFGQADETPYENLACPVLVIGGACDKLKDPGYGDELGRKLRNGEVHILPESGHMPNIERASEVNALLIDFLKRVHAADSGL